MTSEVAREADDLLRYYSELSRRLAQAGVRDVPELLALYERVGRALDAVSRQEIEWAAEQAERLIGSLERMHAALQTLRRFKDALDRVPGI
jgi:hypothetical protein